MANITLRAAKGSPLTIAEVDGNFSSLKVGADRAEAGTSANMPSSLVARDAAGNFSAGTITAALLGNASTSSAVIGTASGTNTIELVRGNMADNDYFRIAVTGTGTNGGVVEFATADDGNEPLLFRQYSGLFSSLVRTATILGSSGETMFPVSVTSPVFLGNLQGNASTASTLQTARTISLSGDVSGSASFNGGSDANIAVSIQPNSVALGTDTTGSYVAVGAVSGNGLSGSANAETATFTVSSNATNTNTSNTIVFRDASGNFAAGTITAALIGNATTASTATTATNQSGGSVNATTGTFNSTVRANAGYYTTGSTSIGMYEMHIPGTTASAMYLTNDGVVRIANTNGEGGGIGPSNMSLTSVGDLTARASVQAPVVVSSNYRSPVISTSENIDISTSNYFAITINGNTTFSFSNVSSGAISFTVKVVHNSGTITWPSSVVWPSGYTPNPTAGKTHLFMFTTDNSGGVYRAAALLNYGA